LFLFNFHPHPYLLPSREKEILIVKKTYLGTTQLVLANRYRLIPSLEHALLQVKEAGLYLSDEFIHQLLMHEKNRVLTQ
jgi:hypothetical protein